MSRSRSSARRRPTRWRGVTGWRARAGCAWVRKTGARSGSPSSLAPWTSRPRCARYVRNRVKYVDASAVLRILFSERGPTVPLVAGDRLVSSQLVEVEAFRAVDRERLLGNLDDVQTATKRKELSDLLRMLDLAPIERDAIERARNPFAVNVRALDAI